MFLTTADLSAALGVLESEIASGATWQLPGGDDGSSVTVAISHDDDGNLSVSAAESAPGEESAAIAWLSGTPREDGYDLVGQDRTGEASNSDDPRSAAAAIRRQIHAILQSEGGRKVA
jgi:hypothetical protein